jgi:hypothetical protein
MYLEIADEDESTWRISKMAPFFLEENSEIEDDSSSENSIYISESTEEITAKQTVETDYVYVLYEDNIFQVFSGKIFEKFRISKAKSIYSLNIEKLEQESSNLTNTSSETEIFLKPGSLLYEDSSYALSSAEVNFFGKTEKLKGEAFILHEDYPGWINFIPDFESISKIPIIAEAAGDFRILIPPENQNGLEQYLWSISLGYNKLEIIFSELSLSYGPNLENQGFISDFEII